MAELIERSITETRTRASIRSENKLVSLSGFIAETYTAASLQAELRGCNLVAAEVDPTLAVDVDTVLLSGAVMNLLTNAFKFTYHATTVCLDAYATADRILISVSDHCGGIPPELVDTMFLPFAQGSADHSGLGLGLSISRKYVEACHGTLTCRNMPGEGCVFTIDLPRRLLQPALAAAPV
jgi:signal transduction histidine kinase